MSVKKSPNTPNAETQAAFEELESGGGFKFSGSTEELFAELEADDQEQIARAREEYANGETVGFNAIKWK